MRQFKIFTLFFTFIINYQNLHSSHNLTVSGLDDAQISRSLQTILQNHDAKGSLSWSDIRSLKTSTVNSIMDIGTASLTKEELFEIHEDLSQTLKNELLNKQYIPSTWLDKLNLLSVSCGTCLLGTVGAFAFDNGIIKDLSIAGALVGGLGTLISLPSIRNLIFRKAAGKLLPSSYGDDEISIQSQLISLMSLAFNSNNIVNLKNSESNVKRHAHQLSEYIMSQFKFESDSLCSYIDTSNAHPSFPTTNS